MMVKGEPEKFTAQVRPPSSLRSPASGNDGCRCRLTRVALLRLARAACVPALLVACDTPRNSTSSAASSPRASDSAAEVSDGAETANAPATPSCIVPTSETPPPEASPAASCPEDPTGPPDLENAQVTFVDAPDSPSITVENAQTHAQRQRGLMYRTEMADDAGMIFSFDDERIRSFWMRNTCIPLDMLFIDNDGFILGILEQVPVLNQAPRSIRCPARYVLEVNAGWTREHGVVAGQTVRIETE